MSEQPAACGQKQWVMMCLTWRYLPALARPLRCRAGVGDDEQDVLDLFIPEQICGLLVGGKNQLSLPDRVPSGKIYLHLFFARNESPLPRSIDCQSSASMEITFQQR